MHIAHTKEYQNAICYESLWLDGVILNVPNFGDSIIIKTFHGLFLTNLIIRKFELNVLEKKKNGYLQQITTSLAAIFHIL